MDCTVDRLVDRSVNLLVHRIKAMHSVIHFEKGVYHVFSK